MDLILHEAENFMSFLIPDILIRTLPTIISTFVISLAPVTPINLLIFVSIFMFLYITDIFDLATSKTYTCKYNQVQETQKKSIFRTLINAYKYYLFVSIIINYNTIYKMQIKRNYIRHII